jgi:hypothetical protein
MTGDFGLLIFDHDLFDFEFCRSSLEKKVFQGYLQRKQRKIPASVENELESQRVEFPPSFCERSQTLPSIL